MQRANYNKLNTGQVDSLEDFVLRRPANRVNEANECNNFLLQLGLSQYCANQLTIELMQRPNFDLLQLQQHWSRLRQLWGSQRSSEVDAIVMREIQQQLQAKLTTPMFPTPPQPPISPLRRWRNSTPIAGNKDDYSYNIDNDPRNIKEQQQSTNYYPQHREETAYNIHEDPRHAVEDQDRHQQADPYNNREHGIVDDPIDHLQQEENNYNRCAQVERFQSPRSNYVEQHNEAFRKPYYKFSTIDQNNCYDNSNNAIRYPRERPRYPLQQINHYHNRDNRHHNNYKPYKPYYEQYPKRSQKGAQNNVNNEQELKRRRLNELPLGQRIFVINGFEMPYIKYRKDSLPQPEHYSYLIQFYRLNRTSAAGGMRLRCRTAKIQRIVNPVVGLDTTRRLALKRIRREIRENWNKVFVNLNYAKWELWWKEFKWCEEQVENELKRYADIDLNALSFLHDQLSYDRPNGAVTKVINRANAAFSNNNDFHASLSIICELMNLQFLTRLSEPGMGRLQDEIRYMPNDLWTYKLKGFVYLWSRYSALHSCIDLTIPIESREVLATKAQWTSPLFHWLAREAIAELKRISAIEWQEHKKASCIDLD